MSLEHKWDKILKRNWDELRDAWIADVPTFPGLGAPPDPGLERLVPLLQVSIPNMDAPPSRVQDVSGIRRNALWEAVFLFHKCSHSSLAAQRLGQQGMHSWCMFNAYHSAYLGAKGTMSLLGVVLPNLDGKQVAIDLFPVPAELKPSKAAAARAQVSPRFQEFLVIRLPQIEQREFWGAFQRVLRISTATCWDLGLRKELSSIAYRSITPPRNHFLYQAHFWPLGDLMSDASVEEMDRLIGTELDSDDEGFLLQLCFCVYRLFEQLMSDLGKYSAEIKAQLDGSRFLASSDIPEFGPYRMFLSQVSAGT